MKPTFKLAIGVFTVLLASVVVHAQPPKPKQLESFWTRARDRAKTERDRLRIQLSELKHEQASEKYISGNGPITDALETASELLKLGLEVGDNGHAVAYEKRILRLESIASQKLEQLTGTQKELDLVKSARLDSLLRKLLDDSDD